jgi:hypothetical protein
MQATESDHSADDSGASDDPHQPRAMPNSLLQLEGDYASGSGSVVPATPEKSFEEQDDQSDGSEHHFPAQPPKRRRLPTKRIAPVHSDSDCVERDSLLGSPSSHKRGFKRPRQPWCLVKVWSLDDYDKEFAYEEKSRLL